MKTSYYIAGKAIAALCQKYFADQSEQHKAANKIARDLKLKITGFVTQGGFGARIIRGFVIKPDSAIDEAVFKRSKDVRNGWTPRHGTKLGKEIAKKLSALKEPNIRLVMDAIGMKGFDGSIRFRSPGIEIKDGKCLIEVPVDVKPKGCRRISDLQKEKMFGK